MSKETLVIVVLIAFCFGVGTGIAIKEKECEQALSDAEAMSPVEMLRNRPGNENATIYCTTEPWVSTATGPVDLRDFFSGTEHDKR